ncbi:penicillin acylase family protein, partial [Streptomyces brasiliscabiei]|uniref:penicillin acylase family protein n=1 Tax=Streptomyces brasiliscabiei TaxID=2736302 RepID=UPI0038F65C9D
ARSAQIRDRLFAQNHFDEADFNTLQHDNEARFLKSWYTLLLSQLSKQADTNQQYITLLNDWQACACPDSIGYTLVRGFRDEIINIVF